MSDFLDEMHELARLRERVRERIGRLQAIVKKLPLYELVPDPASDASAPETIATGTPHGPSHVTVNVHGTVGTLNTGQVLGDIHSHVAAVTGSPSADAFREAVDGLAATIAQDPDLSDEMRKEALQSIDALAEEAGREPEKRRRGILRGMMVAIPGAIEVSAQALKAWDTYGPIIQAHLDELGK